MFLEAGGAQVVSDRGARVDSQIITHVASEDGQLSELVKEMRRAGARVIVSSRFIDVVCGHSPESIGR